MATILIVDDDPDTREILSRCVERVGHRAVPADNGWEALLALDGQTVDAIVLDLMMPGMDGPTFLKILREGQDRAVAQIPVVVLSALSPETARKRLGRLGVEAIVPKASGRLEDLMGIVQQHVGAAHSN
jgi:two-component system, CAI-1 autoinducer sensor kinase/phosphatase CqsS